MNAAGQELQKAIYAAALADAGLKALIGNPPRLYDGPPDKPVFPHAVFGDARMTPLAGTDDVFEHDLRLHVHSRYDGRREARDIVTAFVSLLSGASLTLSGYRLVSLRAVFTDVIHRQDAGAYQGVIRLRAVTEPQ